MGQITSLFAHKVVAAATDGYPQKDERRRALLASANIDPQAPVDPKVMIDDRVYYDLCERAAREDANGASLPVRVGSLMQSDDYGAFGLAWKSAVNLRGSYERAERYWRMLTSVTVYEVGKVDGNILFKLHRNGERILGLRLSNEQSLVAVTQISREVCSKHFSPEKVYFKHSGPEDISAHQSYFGCPVVFDADHDALQVAAETLEVPNRLGDPKISQFFDTHLDAELSELSDDGGLDHRVRNQIAQTLSEGVPLVSQIAERLGMSGRTLQRRLADRGLAYQDIVDSARRELAERLLRDTDYALAEVAFLTGFSEQSAFNRAFKRWSGETPRSYRLKPL